jgi:hypothetical protein
MKPGTVCYIVRVPAEGAYLNGRVVTIVSRDSGGIYEFTPTLYTHLGPCNRGEREYLLPISDHDAAPADQTRLMQSA